MMLVGDKALFAIEWHIETCVDAWVFGHFRFWAKAQPIGNWEDSTSLGGVKNWMCAFAKEEGQRINVELFVLPLKEAFNILYDSVFVHTPKDGTEQREVSRLFRHYISHLGMSAFDTYDIFLIDGESHQRLIWRSANDPKLNEVVLPRGEMQKIALVFCYEISKPI